jgi:hypothetical protein
MARKRKQASLNKPQKEAAIVESAAKSPGAETRPDSEVKQKADSKVNESTAASADEIPGARKDLQEKFRKSHKFIKERIVTGDPPEETLDITEQFQDSHLALGDYVTLDWQHCKEIYSLMAAIHEYATDRSRRRPLNIIMQAEPGSGKSYFIECLAKKMSQDRISDVTFNMATLQGVDDFVQPLEAVRNLKVVDKLPILFLDEFDSDKKNYPLLLPLLWDGKLGIGHRELRIGKVVIILAGSGPEVEEAMKTSKGMQGAGVTEFGKLTDLLSRINGGELTIPRLDEMTDNRDRRVDKVCLTLSLLRQRFGPRLVNAPWALLRFVAETKFRYGVRSINHLIDLIPFKDFEKGTLQTGDLHFPLGTVKALKSSSLANHLIAEDGPAAVVEMWNNLKSHEASVKFDKPRLTWLWPFLSFKTSTGGLLKSSPI